MADKLTCKCSTCSDVVHVYCKKSSAMKHLKLLEQAQCAHCWRPLKITSSWPGPKESQRPPYGNGGSIMVAQCGHLYHGTCVGKKTHCGLCFSKIQKMVPFHYQEQSGQPKCESKPKSPSESASSSKDPEMADTKEEDPKMKDKNLEGLINSLTGRIEVISEEIVQLRRQLAKPPKAANRWR